MTKLTLEQRRHAAGRYQGFMYSIKARSLALERASDLYKEGRLYTWETESFGYLMVRMVCELIALACLTANHEVPKIRLGKMREEWSAGKILAELEKLHPDFYPQPHYPLVDVEGNVIKLGADLEDGQTLSPHMTPLQEEEYLTKDELVALVGRCGARLHVGPTKHLFKSRDADFHLISDGMKKIENLLRNHKIAFYDPNYFIWTYMEQERGADPESWLLSSASFT
jgi:hypothetical protein